MAPGKTNKVNLQLSKGIFLANILKRLLVTGFMDFGVNSEDKLGSECSVLMIQGVDNKGTRSIDMDKIGQPNLALMESKLDCDPSVLGVSTVEEVAFPEMISGEEESLADCNPLVTIIPSGRALLMEAYNNSEVLDVSNWVKNIIPSFSKVIGLSVKHHEQLCIAYLQRLEKEMEVSNQQQKKAATNQIVASSMDKGKRELRNLISNG